MVTTHHLGIIWLNGLEPSNVACVRAQRGRTPPARGLDQRLREAKPPFGGFAGPEDDGGERPHSPTE